VQFLTESAKKNRFADLRRSFNSGNRDVFGEINLYCFLIN
jgi:hypothetical protein